MCFKLELMLTQLEETVRDLEYGVDDWVIYFHRNNGMKGVYVIRYASDQVE